MLGLASIKSIVSIHAPAQGGEMLTSRAKVGRISETTKPPLGKCCGKCNSCPLRTLGNYPEKPNSCQPLPTKLTYQAPALPTKPRRYLPWQPTD